MHAAEAGQAVYEAKAGGACRGGGSGRAGQKQGAAAARLRSALEDRVIKLEAARHEETAAVDFFNMAMRADKCLHVLHDEGMSTPISQAWTTPCGDRCSNCIQGLRVSDNMDWGSTDREIAQVFENCVHGGPTLTQAEAQVFARVSRVSLNNVRLRLRTLMCLGALDCRAVQTKVQMVRGKKWDVMLGQHLGAGKAADPVPPAAPAAAVPAVTAPTITPEGAELKT